MLIDSFT